MISVQVPYLIISRNWCTLSAALLSLDLCSFNYGFANLLLWLPIIRRCKQGESNAFFWHRFDYQPLFGNSLVSLLGEERRSDSRKRRKSSLNNIWLHAFEEGRRTLFLHAWCEGRTNRTLPSLQNKTKIESGANYKTAAHAFVTATLQDCGLFWSPAMKTGATVVLEMCPKISNAFRRV